MRLPPSLLQSLRSADVTAPWPACIATDDAVRSAVERALGQAAPELRAVLLERLLNGQTNTWYATRACLWTDRLARQAGGVFDTAGPGPLLRYQTAGGESVWFAPLSFRTLEHLSGPPAAVRRLVQAVETVLLPHRFAIHFREPISADADPSNLAASVFGWIRDVERGNAPRTASFDDEDANIHVDLDLLVGTGASRAWFVSPPLRGPEWLGLIDRRVQQLMRMAPPGEDVIPVLCADPQWSLGRGFQCQWLYGTPTEVSVTGVRSAEIGWPGDAGLFAQPFAEHIPAIWWLENGPAGPMSAAGWSHDHPQRDRVALPFPGARLGRHSDGPTWSWDTPPPTAWETP